MTVRHEAAVILVRLSDIPLHRRQAAADRVIRSEHLTGLEALEVKLAAQMPRHDPYRVVTPSVAWEVLK